MDLEHIRYNVKDMLSELPEGVTLVAAAKTRTHEEILEAVNAGITAVGENYVQEAQEVFSAIGNAVKWHFIGHLQKNKVKKAVEIFDVIETVDSYALAEEISKRAGTAGKTLQVLIEVNSGREEQKFGVFPEDTEKLAREIAVLPNIKLSGIMTMGPFEGDPENARPCFRETRQIFEAIKELNIDNTDIRLLSMGMTNSYRVALEEGANIVRIGTKIFGERIEK